MAAVRLRDGELSTGAQGYPRSPDGVLQRPEHRAEIRARNARVAPYDLARWTPNKGAAGEATMSHHEMAGGKSGGKSAGTGKAASGGKAGAKSSTAKTTKKK
jgi:hypothetical protein